MLRVESGVFAAVGVAIALVFFPLWFAIPVAVVLAAVYAGMAVAGTSVVVDRGAGLLVFRMGLITRRVRLTDISAVLVDNAKFSIARSTGGEISLYIWGNSWLDRWLRAPAEATDIGHAIAGGVALAQDGQSKAGNAGAADQKTPVRTGTSAGARSVLASALLGGVGLVAMSGAPCPGPLAQRRHDRAGRDPRARPRHSGLAYLLFALWILLTRRPARPPADRTSTA